MGGQLHVAADTTVTPLSVATFVIAVLAWVTALVAILWNILQWLLTPGRARVYLRWGYRNMSGGKDGPPRMSDERRVRGPWYDLDVGEGYVAMIDIEVVNRGRMKLSVREIYLQFVVNDLRPPDLPFTGPALPCSIDSYHSETWTIEVRRLQKGATERLFANHWPKINPTDFVRPVVRLSDRRTISPWYRIEISLEAPAASSPSAGA